MKKPTCVDCLKEGITTVRAIDPRSGPRSPRCATHMRAKKKSASARSHALRTVATYGITGEEYWLLYASQEGRCFVCRKGRGLSRRLSVDHEHNLCDTHPPDQGCALCIRALLCSRCNTLLGWLDADALTRAIAMLMDPPARRILAEHRANTRG